MCLNDYLRKKVDPLWVNLLTRGNYNEWSQMFHQGTNLT